MITDFDIKKLKKVFVTKEDLKKFASKDDLKQLETRFTNNIVEFKDEILHEIVALREDITVILGQRDIIEDHEIRI